MPAMLEVTSCLWSSQSDREGKSPMIKRIGLVVSVCLSVLLSTNVIAEPYMSDSSRQKYLKLLDDYLDVYDNTSHIALGVAPNGCWATGWGNNRGKAKRLAIKNCNDGCKVSSCQVFDVNGTSDFIKKKSSSTSSSTSSSSQTQSGPSIKEGSSELLSSGSFVAECEKNNQLDVNYSGNRCDLVWNKLGESNRCKISNSVMTFQTYDSGGPVKLNFSSGELKHGANTYQCSFSGDIKVVEKEDTSKTSAASSSSASTSTSGSSSTSSTSSGSNFDPAVEIEFWKSIKDSDDPDMFQAYLDEYPNGIFAPLAKIKIKKLKSSGDD